MGGELRRSQLGAFLLGQPEATAAVPVVAATSRVTLAALAYREMPSRSGLVVTAVAAATRDARVSAFNVAAIAGYFQAERVTPTTGRVAATIGARANGFVPCHLGRLRRGDRVLLFCKTTDVPDFAPVAVVMNAAGDVVLAREIASWRRSRTRFGGVQRIDQRFDLGTYTVSYQYTVDGVPYRAEDGLEVVAGGDSGGEVLALYALERPKSRLVLAQLGCGRLTRGRNPTLQGSES
jgi:hypothetical protein